MFERDKLAGRRTECSGQLGFLCILLWGQLYSPRLWLAEGVFCGQKTKFELA